MSSVHKESGSSSAFAGLAVRLPTVRGRNDDDDDSQHSPRIIGAPARLSLNAFRPEEQTRFLARNTRPLDDKRSASASASSSFPDFQSSEPRPSAITRSERGSPFVTTYYGPDALCTSPTPRAASPSTLNVLCTQELSDMEIFPTFREVTDQYEGVNENLSNGVGTSKNAFPDPSLDQKEDQNGNEPPSDSLSSNVKQSTPSLTLSRPFSSSELLSDYKSRASTDNIVEDVARRLPKSENIAFEENVHSHVVNDEERVFYRSWREGGHVLGPLSGRFNIRRNTGEHEIDKKIEATLPSSEPTYHPRSRKASLYLRLFKDNDTSKRNRSIERKSGLPDANVEKPGPWTGSRTELSSNDKQHTSKGYDPAQISIYEDSRLGKSTYTNSRQVREVDCSEESREDASSVDSSIKNSVPSEVKEAGILETSKSLNNPSREPLESRGGASFQYTNEAEIVHSTAIDLEKEHISSALYIPHRSSSLIGTADDRDTATSNRDTSPSSRSVEISLQAKDESQILHGDLGASQRLASYDHCFNADLDSTSKRSNKSERKYHTEKYHHDDHVSSKAQRDSVPADKTQPVDSSNAGVKGQLDDVPLLEAVELKPYDHQVGGHSTVYRFSRRAVCKQLNNRENEFYETIERTHAELLHFLPR